MYLKLHHDEQMACILQYVTEPGTGDMMMSERVNTLHSLRLTSIVDISIVAGIIIIFLTSINVNLD